MPRDGRRRRTRGGGEKEMSDTTFPSSEGRGSAFRPKASMTDSKETTGKDVNGGRLSSRRSDGDDHVDGEGMGSHRSTHVHISDCCIRQDDMSSNYRFFVMKPSIHCLFAMIFIACNEHHTLFLGVIG